MKLSSTLFAISLLLLSTYCQASDSKTQSATIQQLRQFQQQDYFLPDNFLYTGIKNPQLKQKLNQNIADTSQAFIKLYESHTPPSKKQLLKTLADGINQIDPYSLDTDDREQVAVSYEKFLDIIGLESSDGILNTWVYGEVINKLIEQKKSVKP